MTSHLPALHAEYSPDWWTPPEWLAWVDETFLGEPWLDPCPAYVREADRDMPPGALADYKYQGDSSALMYCNHPGARGSTDGWWTYCIGRLLSGPEHQLIWCAFNIEQLRHMKPSPFNIPGWLVMPRKRIGFIWGGPDTDKRKHGERATQPGNWTVFWSSVKPAPTPEPCVVSRTGVDLERMGRAE